VNHLMRCATIQSAIMQFLDKADLGTIPTILVDDDLDSTIHDSKCADVRERDGRSDRI
jgi:hypothetical protein